MIPGDCPVCGEPTVRGLATCLPCAGLGADGLVYARPPAGSRSSLTTRLRSFLGRRGDLDGLELAAQGSRAIAAVPLESAGTVASVFEDMGIPVRVTPARLGWARLPRGVVFALGLMTLAGLSAGWMASSPFLLLTPVMLVLVLLLAQARLKAPLVEATKGASLAGSPELAREVGRRLSRMGVGAARQRLGRIAGLARVLDSRMGELDDDEATGNLRVLVESAGPVAEELARLTELKTLLEDPALVGDGEQKTTAEEVTRKQRQLTEALDSAIRILERSAQGSPLALRNAAQLPALAQAIQRRIEAWDEVLAAIGPEYDPI
ncbi:MAG: hypothetical protein OEO23_02855 [Gemmatimonadota bacterium]|nr:hypothetical protein [Gemmatimonadota bacterium]